MAALACAVAVAALATAEALSVTGPGPVQLESQASATSPPARAFTMDNRYDLAAENGQQYPGVPAQAQWVEQRLDHFDWRNTRTFKQRYFVNDKYFQAGSDGPVFLCVGGEGPPLDGMVVVNSVHCNDAVELLPQVGGLMLALEHRYYGESVPTDDLDTENLRWLSSKQALADLAHFQAYITQKFGLRSRNKWVTWGGSYPGMLAAWARLKYPHLFHAAVASSAPMKAELDFQGYLNTVADALAEPLVGGSAECLRAVQDGHARIGELLHTPDGRQEVAELFNVCGGADSLEAAEAQQAFAGFGVVSLDYQGNNPACKGYACNIEQLCKEMLRNPTEKPMASLARISARQQNNECKMVSPADELKGLLNTDKRNGDRVWFYQTCTEFAFFQTCEVGSRCPFAQGHLPLQNYLDKCSKAFGFTPAQVMEAVQFSNSYYGADRPRGTRILLPNGSVDPWSALGVVESPDDVSEPTLWIRGASHHAWTHPSSPADQPTVIAARKQIWAQVLGWLQQS